MFVSDPEASNDTDEENFLDFASEESTNTEDSVIAAEAANDRGFASSDEDTSDNVETDRRPSIDRDKDLATVQKEGAHDHHTRHYHH